MAAFLLEHVASIVGFALAIFLLSRERWERRPASVTIAWLLAIVLVPYFGVPLYMMFGGRKLARRAAAKLPLPRTKIPPEPHATAVDRLLDGLAVSPATQGNRVTWLTSGEAAYATLLDLIDTAERSIHITTFILGGDAVGDAIVDRLIARAQEGLEVRLLLDALFARRPNRARLDALRAAGGQVAIFMPFLHVPLRGHANLRNHRKMTLVDGRRALLGGMNLASEYMGPTPLPGRWRDVGLAIEGPAARDLETVFRSDWTFALGGASPAEHDDADRQLPFEPGDARATGTGLALPSSVRVVPSGPDAATDLLYDVLLSALFAAERRIWIATPYFVPDEALVRALVLACRRGVDVRVVVPAHSNHLSADLAGGPSLRAVGDAGGSIRPFAPGMLHAKCYLVDDALAVVGSANFDMRSLFLNYEIGVALSDTRDIDRLAAWFEEVLTECADGPRAPGRLRAAAEDVARLVGPLV